jgi:hypothetical protein
MLVYLDADAVNELKTYVSTQKGYKSVSTNLLSVSMEKQPNAGPGLSA